MNGNLFCLSESDKRHLESVRASVVEHLPLGGLEDHCSEISPRLADPGFAFTYAAILCATRDRVDEATQLFALNEGDPFCSVIREYLERTNVFAFDLTIFADASPYRAWFASQFHRQYQPGVVKNAVAFAKTHPPPTNNGTATIVDVGTGNGMLIEKVVNAIGALHELKRIKLILIEPSSDMLEAAKLHCERHIALPTEIIPLQWKVQEMTSDQWATLEQASPIWFTNISIAIHHMPRSEKLPLVRKLSTVTPYILFGEANWTDELPKDSPELAYVTAKTYGLIFEDILGNQAAPEDQRAAIYQFLLPEAISILREEIGQRTDYHMTMADWTELAEEAGFQVTRTDMTTHLKGHPIAFAAEWRSITYR